jgi:LemA protein
MKKPNLFIILGVLVFIAVFWGISTYNMLVRLNQEVNAGWAQVETQYQRRYDLIPNLVEATKGTLTQEQEVFSKIAEARQGYAGAQTQSDKISAAQNLDSALARLLVIVENYPELKSNETVLSLMDEIAGTENRISVERKRYNDIVRTFNNKSMTFPTVLFARMFGYSQKPYYESVKGSEIAPKVDLKVTE